MKRGANVSGVKRIRLHDTRHSHCALLFEMGIPPLEVAERLGHAHVSTTTDIYSHIIKESEERVSDCIADVVLRNSKKTPITANNS